MKKTYHYMVSYSVAGGGFGRLFSHREMPITHESDITDIEAWLNREHPCVAPAVIINYVLMRVEESQ